MTRLSKYADRPRGLTSTYHKCAVTLKKLEDFISSTEGQDVLGKFHKFRKVNYHVESKESEPFTFFEDAEDDKMEGFEGDEGEETKDYKGTTESEYSKSPSFNLFNLLRG